VLKFKLAEVVLKAVDDTVVSGDLRWPVASFRVVAQGLDVIELRGERWEELR